MKKKFVECDLGVMVPEKMASRIDSIVKGLPQELRTYKRFTSITKTEFDDGEHADISTVSTPTIDRDGDIVLAKGIDLEVYQANPIVLWQHNADLPIGHCAWITNTENGIRAKTIYAKRPEGWATEWLPEYVYELTKAGVIRSKSVGLIPLQMDEPNEEQKAMGAKRILSRCHMFEYSSVSVPANPDALVEAISKGLNPGNLHLLGIDWKRAVPLVVPVPKKKIVVPAPKKDNGKVLQSIKDMEKRIDELMKRLK